MRRTQRHASSHLDGLVPRAADLEIDAILAFERHFAVVQAAGEMHQAECPNELVGIEAFPKRVSRIFAGLRQANIVATEGVSSWFQFKRRIKLVP